MSPFHFLETQDNRWTTSWFVFKTTSPIFSSSVTTFKLHSIQNTYIRIKHWLKQILVKLRFEEVGEVNFSLFYFKSGKLLKIDKHGLKTTWCRYGTVCSVLVNHKIKIWCILYLERDRNLASSNSSEMKENKLYQIFAEGNFFAIYHIVCGKIKKKS